ncbi:hypothetical protein MOQ_007670 [Trypanosoma cruzi marinkellei]|uniref:F-box domain-containing protein n=1 Tax=Trypanosoma cruzi marinkellei TaxID=85056 RepID=K2MSH1_TRYCR|nr:hypothetical protein MOQ_007670 [Trypanosoma cruzi marinkellei]
MPHFFSNSSVSFLRRFQFLQRSRHGEATQQGSIPTDTLSLMDVLLHTNSIFTLFFHLQHALDAAQTNDGNSSTQQTEELANALHHLAEDMTDFDGGLSEEVLGPLLLSFLNFYLDRNIDMMSIRRTLCTLFETTPYLREMQDEDGDKNPPLSSNIALLLLNLSKALLHCQAKGEMFLRKKNGVVQQHTLPLLPWLRSCAKNATQKPTWYWWASQNSRTLSILMNGAFVYRSTTCEATADADAILVSYATQPAKRKRWRGVDDADDVMEAAAAAAVVENGRIFLTSQTYLNGGKFSLGIIPLPYAVQGMILEYLSPRALSAACLVCKVWWSLMDQSLILRFYLFASRAVTRVFIQFFEDDWGKAWVQLNELTTFRRLSLQRMYICLVQNHLHRQRASATSLGDFVLRLYNDFGIKSPQWEMLEGLWNAMEVEMKVMPFLALRDMTFSSPLHNGTIPGCCNVISRTAALVQMKQALRLLKSSDYPFFSLFNELLRRWSVLLSAVHSPPSAEMS